MKDGVRLRDVVESDLPTLFEHQLDPEANQMAAFTVEDPSDRAAFDARWSRLLADESVTKKTIVHEGRVAGSVLSWMNEGRTEVTYWLGREFWGKGIATRSLARFLDCVRVRPVRARVAKDNVASLRVLRKCGFHVSGEDAGYANARRRKTEEWVLTLGADEGGTTSEDSADTVRIALVQQSAGSDREANLARGLDTIEEAARGGARIVCFAELAFEPFHPQEPAAGDPGRFAETIPGPTTEALTAAARRHGVVLVTNLLEREGDLTYDASPVIDADGTLLGCTRMVHVPDYACFHERSWYTPGDRGAPVFETAFGRIGVAICYDRHYPEYMRALALNGAEVVVVPQAGAVDEWPAGLYEAEMRVAAFHHGYFTALCNRVGREARLEFAGESFVCDPEGRIAERAGTGTEEILACDLDLRLARNSTARRLFLPDRRPELYPDWFAPERRAEVHSTEREE